MVFKKEFIEHYMEMYSCTKKEALQAYENVFGCLADFVYGQGKSVCVKDYGTFRIKDFAARKSTHPGTGEPMVLPARRVVTFTQARLVSKNEITTGA